ncbi:MAG: acid shock protein [Bdellovibrionota bacterium]
MLKKSFSLIVAALALTLGLSSCSSCKQTQNTATAPAKNAASTAAPSPTTSIKLEELTQTNTDPNSFYKNAYKGYSVECYQTILELVPFEKEDGTEYSEEELKSMEGGEYVDTESRVVMYAEDADENFHIYRKGFEEEHGLEVIQIGNKSWQNKNQDEPEYKDAPVPAQIGDWKSYELRQALLTFVDQKIDANAKAFSDQGENCYRNDKGYLCFDPKTGLPVRGEVSVKKSEDQKMEVILQVSPSTQDDPITIDDPREL